MRRIVFVDLDDTLFQTARKTSAADRADATVGAVDRAGAPLSFHTARQARFLDWLTAREDPTAPPPLVVPVTGRNVEAYRRIRLPLEPPAICSFGGVILTAEGTPDPLWHQEMTARSQAEAKAMAALEAAVARRAAQTGTDVRHRVILDAGLPLYISVKHNGEEAWSEAMPPLAEALEPDIPEGWTLHLNGSNLALLPPFLGKKAAVAHFLTHLPVPDEAAQAAPPFTIGVGDSLTDLGFMGLCDVAVVPRPSQIQAALEALAPAPRTTPYAAAPKLPLSREAV